MARGIKDKLDRWVNDMLAQYLPYEYAKDKKGLVQLSMRPIILYEIVFPEEHLDYVLGLMRHKHDYKSKFVFLLRKMLGAKAIKKPYPEWNKRVITGDFVSVIPVGIKKDEFIKGIEQL